MYHVTRHSIIFIDITTIFLMSQTCCHLLFVPSKIHLIDIGSSRRTKNCASKSQLEVLNHDVKSYTMSCSLPAGGQLVCMQQDPM